MRAQHTLRNAARICCDNYHGAFILCSVFLFVFSLLNSFRVFVLASCRGGRCSAFDFRFLFSTLKAPHLLFQTWFSVFRILFRVSVLRVSLLHVECLRPPFRFRVSLFRFFASIAILICKNCRKRREQELPSLANLRFLQCAWLKSNPTDLK